MGIITSDKKFLLRYKKKHNPEELEGSVKTCSHCGRGKQRRCGRYWTPCPVCSDIQPYKKKIRIK